MPATASNNTDATFSYSYDVTLTSTIPFPPRTTLFPYTTLFRSADPKCSATATVSITVTPVNDAPVANNDSATVAEGGTVTVLDSTAASVLANDKIGRAHV